MDNLAEQLVQWSGEQRNWQRDLLRRIAKGEIQDSTAMASYADYAIRDEYAKESGWITPPETLSKTDLEPLLISHLTKTDNTAEPVIMGGIKHLSGANHLAPGAELEFESPGLNIVAGRNGSGKSGYTRIIKQVAASRAPGSVLPNIYQDSCDPSAIIRYKVGDSEEREFTWMPDSEQPKDELRRIRVFDSLSALSHLAQSAEVAYVPPVLQILSDYVVALEKISALVEAKLTEESLQEPGLSELNRGLGVDIIESLGQKSAIARLEALTDLTQAEEERVKELPGIISLLEQDSPAKLSSQAADRAHRLRLLREQIARLPQRLNTATAERVAKLVLEREAAKRAAEEAVASLDSDQTLVQGTGDPTWRLLWSAACEHALASNEESQEMSELQACPLCQQTLSDEARSRFRKFKTFVANEAQTKLDLSEESLRTELAGLREIVIPHPDAQIELISSYNQELAGPIRSLLENYLSAREDLVTAASGVIAMEPSSVSVKQVDWDQLSIDTRDATKELERFEKEESDKIQELRTASISADSLLQLRSELDDLILRKKLFAHLDILRIEHDRRLRMRATSKAKGACSTVSATRRNKALSKEYVDKVCEEFKREAALLGIDRVPVALVFEKASRGINYIRVVLEEAPDQSVIDILSEGEQRMAAIAGFFADLTESGDRSVLIFDDPVSSLDQDFRRNVARRLVNEASKRQVLVFSHDLSFVRELYDAHELHVKGQATIGNHDVAELCYVHINRTPNGTGVPTESENWNHVLLKSKIGSVRKRIQDSRVIYFSHDDEAYGRESADISGTIRECWEMFVEQDLLGGVVTRFKRSIETQKLRYVTDISDADIARVNAAMTLHSRELRGHAAAEDDASSPLTPDELEAEIANLVEFRREVEKRRKK